MRSFPIRDKIISRCNWRGLDLSNKKRNGKAAPLVDRNSLKNILKYFNDEAKRIQNYINTEEYLGLLEISSDDDDW